MARVKHAARIGRQNELVGWKDSSGEPLKGELDAQSSEASEDADAASIKATANAQLPDLIVVFKKCLRTW